MEGEGGFENELISDQLYFTLSSSKLAAKV